MNIQSNLYRVACQTLTELPNPGMTTLPSIWLNLPGKTQKQIAQSLARLHCGYDRRARRQRRIGMLSASNRPDERVTGAHRGKLAYIYVRQPSLNQVRHHQESTDCNTASSIARSLPAGRMNVCTLLTNILANPEPGLRVSEIRGHPFANSRTLMSVITGQ
ncbi:hypothetical protein X769_31805 [Mesorhizobium sp. LSJC268A00]|uniref:hypothetical protein n=1 Tax=unclassified Mesorhizobium TaxID=325217 RepID=UPI0003CF6F84|nr:hypothetical protein [Mesorhizobium sp. LSJC268A00]ESW94783.1 hypothetical protein X769_31805 [Mesorhizobium sp. LSJC268A00]